MRQNYTNIFSWLTIFALALTINIASAFQANKSDTTLHLPKTKITTTKNSYPKTGLHLALPPLKPAVTSTAKISVIRTDDKLLTDVQVYPNPVTDIINVKYVLSRNALVTVKVMDVLGNDVMTLVSQRIGSGEQSFTYPVSNKLSRGFYFIRVVAGTESVIKRISVL
ncbi:T9SS type A sorting domain-containing protein [Mucilaginibacter sp. BT774]|uniref:T9SS type A sorting domain-containing protein n=1 Tax=Mucilaginibacter sp. BT774 TaxID=3062276 RepID=UPI00267483D1|nr:T9SS type A sorting domain-containing protein [Mucilaginibacter sp. BT774]MDO3625980.1 T9SS type A sorting domain-containing protein [Mucilaginibacter sp. BT774]